MKNLITILILLVGCATTPTVKSIVGSYGWSYPSKTGLVIKIVFLENKKVESHFNGQKVAEGTWKINGKEIHFLDGKSTLVYKVEPNGNLTCIATIKNGKQRLHRTKARQTTYKKLKE